MTKAVGFYEISDQFPLFLHHHLPLALLQLGNFRFQAGLGPLQLMVLADNQLGFFDEFGRSLCLSEKFENLVLRG